MDIPGELKYTKNDEWIRVDGNVGTVGITDYAQDQLSDVVYVEVVLAEGEEASTGDTCATVESVKAASDVYMPVSGKVTEINDSLIDTPELINTDPYGDAWMIKIEISNPDELTELMDSAAYQSYCDEREH